MSVNTNFFYEYKLFVDVDFQGRISDRGVFRNSAFNKVLERDILNLPDPAPLPTSTDPTWLHEQNETLLLCICCWWAISLRKASHETLSQTNLSDRKCIFNYRVSRIQWISESVFGIWGSQFRVFTTAMVFSSERAVTIVVATVTLHNMLRTKGWLLYSDENALDRENEDGSVKEGNLRSIGTNFLVNIPKNKYNNAQKLAEKVRITFADHFYGPGAIPWQWNVLLWTESK